MPTIDELLHGQNYAANLMDPAAGGFGSASPQRTTDNPGAPGDRGLAPGVGGGYGGGTPTMLGRSPSGMVGGAAPYNDPGLARPGGDPTVMLKDLLLNTLPPAKMDHADRPTIDTDPVEPGVAILRQMANDEMLAMLRNQAAPPNRSFTPWEAGAIAMNPEMMGQFMATKGQGFADTQMLRAEKVDILQALLGMTKGTAAANRPFLQGPNETLVDPQGGVLRPASGSTKTPPGMWGRYFDNNSMPPEISKLLPDDPQRQAWETAQGNYQEVVAQETQDDRAKGRRAYFSTMVNNHIEDAKRRGLPIYPNRDQLQEMWDQAGLQTQVSTTDLPTAPLKDDPSRDNIMSMPRPTGHMPMTPTEGLEILNRQLDERFGPGTAASVGEGQKIQILMRWYPELRRGE